jgi:hypothetical protein
MSLPSGSRVQRAFACLASAVLPRIEVTSEPAQAGTWKHLFFANLRHGLDEALASVPEEYRAACEAIDVSSFTGIDAYDSEVPLVYDVKANTARRLPPGTSHRDYGALSEWEIGMTLDVAGVGPSEVMAADLKTGHGHVPPAHRNWQLAVAALALDALNHKGSARVALIHAPEGVKPWWDVAVLDAFALSDARLQLLALAERLARTSPDNVPMVLGEQCRQCPSRLHCPAHTAFIHAAATGDGEMVSGLTSALTPDKARVAYGRLKVLRGAVKDLEAALAGYAEEHPISLDDGRVYGAKPGTETTVDAVVVRRVLSTLYGAEVADKATEYEASKASVERALRGVYEARKASGQKVTLKALSDEAFGAIEADGGFKVREVTRIKEF